ncbi:MAG TPA: CBS domain-containing protein [Thermoleophilaceae bacterium]|jgi:CBS domain-containing protein
MADEERNEEQQDQGSEGDGGGGDGGGKTKVADVMTKDPEAVEPGSSIEDAAKKMKEKDTGALLVTDGDDLKGIVTDRDIVVNALAEGNADAKVEDIASTDTTTIKKDAELTEAIQKMREANVRRLPVVDDDEGKPVGIVSLGDLAIEADDDSALKDISEASPNN